MKLNDFRNRLVWHKPDSHMRELLTSRQSSQSGKVEKAAWLLSHGTFDFPQ